MQLQIEWWALFLFSLGAVIVEVYSIMAFNKKFNERAEWYEQRGDVGEQFGRWLLYSEKEGDPSNLDVLSRRFAHAMVVGVNAQVAGQKSGDVRRQSMVDNKLFSAIQQANPDAKAIGIFLEKIGLEELNVPEFMPMVLNYLRKNGGSSFSGSNPSSHSSRKSSGDPFKV